MSARSASGERAVRWLLDHRALVLLVLGVATLLAAGVLARSLSARGRLPVDNSLEIWFLEEDPALVAYREYQARWGNDEVVVLGLFDPQGVLRGPTLDLVAELSAALRALPRVKGVTSLSTVRPVREGAQGELLLGPWYRAPVGPAQVAAVASAVRADTLLREHLLAADERATTLVVQLVSAREFDRLRVETLAAVRRVVEETLARHGRDPARDWAWGGIGVIHVALNQLVLADTARFMVWTNLVLVLGLWLTFRRLLAVAVCAASVGWATCLLIGTYLASGLSLNMVTMVLPTLVMVVGLTDAVYFLTSFQQQRRRLPGQDPRQAVIESLGLCFWPGLFNSLTSAVGFLAFQQAPMQVVRYLGQFASLGIGLAFLTSLTTCALVLARWPDRVERPPAPGWLPPGWLPPSLFPARFLAELALRRRGWVLLGGAALTALAVGGILRIRVDSWSLAFFRADHEVRRHDAALRAAVGPYLPLELVLRAPAAGGARDPALLLAQERLVAEVLREEPSAARALSLAAVVRRLHRVLTGDPTAPLPDDPATVEQELLLYDPQRPDDPLQLVDLAYRETRFTFKVENRGALEGRLLLERIHARAAGRLPPGVTLHSGGYMPLYARLIDHLVRSQVTSLALSTLVIALMIALLFRSLRWALAALVPNLVPVLAVLGAMGYLGINLDVGTVLVASVALGVAVDDTVHFVWKYRALLAALGDPGEALRATLATSGRAISASSLVLALGFSVLGLASIATVALFGLLLAGAMLAALLAEVTLTPAVLLLLSGGGGAQSTA